MVSKLVSLNLFFARFGPAGAPLRQRLDVNSPILARTALSAL